MRSGTDVGQLGLARSRQMVKRDSLLQSPKAASFTPLQPMLGIAHGDLRLVCGC